MKKILFSLLALALLFPLASSAAYGCWGRTGYYDGRWSSGGWMLGGVVIFLALLVALAITLGKSGLGHGSKSDFSSQARQILQERLAKGEISPEEFEIVKKKIE